MKNWLRKASSPPCEVWLSPPEGLKSTVPLKAPRASRLVAPRAPVAMT